MPRMTKWLFAVVAVGGLMFLGSTAQAADGHASAHCGWWNNCHPRPCPPVCHPPVCYPRPCPPVYYPPVCYPRQYPPCLPPCYPRPYPPCTYPRPW
jgi:hypothetical protein